MGIISCASGNSCWRGLDYYKDKKVKSIKKISNNEYTSIVHGSSNYEVYLNIEHPRQSTCNCPLAKGKKLICKHIVATYFSCVKDSAEEFEKEQEKLQEEDEVYQDNQYNNMVKYLNKMSKEQLVNEMIYVFDYAPEWIYDDFVKRHDIEG